MLAVTFDVSPITPKGPSNFGANLVDRSNRACGG